MKHVGCDMDVLIILSGDGSSPYWNKLLFNTSSRVSVLFAIDRKEGKIIE
jgi:hypothetical protein